MSERNVFFKGEKEECYFHSPADKIRFGEAEKLPCGHPITSLGYACKECAALDRKKLTGVDLDVERDVEALIELSKALRERGYRDLDASSCRAAIKAIDELQHRINTITDEKCKE